MTRGRHTECVQRFASRAALACLIAAAALSAGSATAGEPPREPFLQVDAGMHSASIRASALAPDESFVVTASADKTVRLWEMPSLRLRRVFRMPVGYGSEGRVHDVAVSPDGRWVAAAGWTGWQWDGSASIYFFDIQTSEIVARLSGLSDPVRNLAYSPDGRFLAVGLMGRGGLRIYRIDRGDDPTRPVYRPHYRDTEYSGRIVSLDFSASGSLVTSSTDGMVRRYAAGFSGSEPPVRARNPADALPLEVRFSPNGKRIALGYHDLPRVDILDARTLKRKSSPSPPSEVGVSSLYAVEWSQDGKTLYAAGDHARSDRNLVVAWGRSGRGKPKWVPTSRASMGRLLPLRDGRLYWGSEDPAMGILDRDLSSIALRESSTLVFRDLDNGLLVSADGAAIGFDGDAPASNIFFDASRGLLASGFSLRELDAANAEERAALRPPRMAAKADRVSLSADRRSASISGRPVELEPYEAVRHSAWSADGDRVALATSWSIRVLDRKGRPIWDRQLPVAVEAVNIAAAGQWLVAAVSDGTLRWFRLEDGAPGVSLFLHENGSDWVAWLPSGTYAASPGGDEFVGWLVNDVRKDRAPAFYRAIQLERSLYAPSALRRAFSPRVGDDEPHLDERRLASMAPPRVEIDLALNQLAPRLMGPTASFQIAAVSRSVPMEEVTVFVNKLPVTRFADRQLAGESRNRFARVVSVPLDAGYNEIRVEVETARSRGIARTLALNDGPPTPPASSDLYVLAVGVGRLLEIADFSLAYAAEDARRIVRQMKRGADGVYGRVHTKLIADGETLPRRSEIESALTFLQSAGPTDTVVLYLAAHALKDKDGNYFLVPSDARRDDIIAINREQATDAASLVPWRVFVDALRAAVGRRVLMVDTCHAQQITGRLELDWLAKNSASSMFALMAASAPEEKSEENDEFGAGLYTQALIEAIGGAGDVNGDQSVSLSEAHVYAKTFVARHRQYSRMEPQMVAPVELEGVLLSHTSEPIPEVRPTE